GVPLSTAVAALVLFPLGTQLYTASSHRVDATPPKKEISVATDDLKAKADQDEAGATVATNTVTLQQQPVLAKPEAPKDAERSRGIVADTTTEEAPLSDALATI